MTVRRTVPIVAAACLLLASSHTNAQAPPAAPDAEQRLKALEDKMDRVLKLLEPRESAPTTPAEFQKQLRLISLAKDEIAGKFEHAQKEYQDFRKMNPLPFGKLSSDLSIIAQRLAKNDSSLLDLQQRQAEVAARTNLVKNVGDNESEARALLVLLQRRGVDVELLRRTGAPGRDETVTAVALVRLYGASLRLEAQEMQQLIQVAEDRIEQDRKTIRDFHAYEVTEETLRSAKDQSRRLLDAIVTQITRMESMRDFGPRR